MLANASTYDGDSTILLLLPEAKYLLKSREARGDTLTDRGSVFYAHAPDLY